LSPFFPPPTSWPRPGRLALLKMLWGSPVVADLPHSFSSFPVCVGPTWWHPWILAPPSGESVFFPNVFPMNQINLGLVRSAPQARCSGLVDWSFLDFLDEVPDIIFFFSRFLVPSPDLLLVTKDFPFFCRLLFPAFSIPVIFRPETGVL